MVQSVLMVTVHLIRQKDLTLFHMDLATHRVTQTHNQVAVTLAVIQAAMDKHPARALIQAHKTTKTDQAKEELGEHSHSHIKVLKLNIILITNLCLESI